MLVDDTYAGCCCCSACYRKVAEEYLPRGDVVVNLYDVRDQRSLCSVEVMLIAAITTAAVSMAGLWWALLSQTVMTRAFSSYQPFDSSDPELPSAH